MQNLDLKRKGEGYTPLMLAEMQRFLNIMYW